MFGVEFSRVQLWQTPPDASSPPPSVLGLAFHEPTVVAFLTARAHRPLPSDWPTALREDLIDPFDLDSEVFTLTSDDAITSLLDGCEVEFMLGDSAQLRTPSPVRLCFIAQGAGIVVRAASMAVGTSSGSFDPESVPGAAAKWWDYWRDYWSKRATPAALPFDPTCEVTIPIDEFHRPR